MAGVAASSVRAREAALARLICRVAQMVQIHAFGDRSVKVFVREHMHRMMTAVHTCHAHPHITLSIGFLRWPPATSVRINDHRLKSVFDT